MGRLGQHVAATFDTTAELDLPAVTIGVLTAVEEEYAACLDVFDPCRAGFERQRRATSGPLTCWICSIAARHGGQHIVAITLLPDMGNNAAAIAANILMQHCPQIRFLIMCGIAGAVPHPGRAGDHVRLGDIVVSNGQGMVQYDRGKQRDPRRSSAAGGAPFAAFEFRSPTRPPCPELLAAVRRIQSEAALLDRKALRDWEVKIDAFLARRDDRSTWKRPHWNKDRLIDTPDGLGPSMRHPKNSARRAKCPTVFLGPIGAANIVLADAQRRDFLREQFGIKAVEMEGSGVADACWATAVGYLVVRGTCDYCNSTKNDVWRRYAALIAAAFTHTVIEYLHPIGDLRADILGTATSLDTSSEPMRQAAGAGVHLHPSGGMQVNVVGPLPIQAEAAHPIGQATLTSVDLPRLEASDAQEPGLLPPQHIVPTLASGAGVVRNIADIIAKIETLMRSLGWSDVARIECELAEALEVLPRRGTDVRDGWILLGRLEAQRLRTAKLNGEVVDVTRLRQLRKEAASVID
jgi:nucleoside phosphorylase